MEKNQKIALVIIILLGLGSLLYFTNIFGILKQTIFEDGFMLYISTNEKIDDTSDKCIKIPRPDYIWTGGRIFKSNDIYCNFTLWEVKFLRGNPDPYHSYDAHITGNELDYTMKSTSTGSDNPVATIYIETKENFRNRNVRFELYGGYPTTTEIKNYNTFINVDIGNTNIILLRPTNNKRNFKGLVEIIPNILIDGEVDVFFQGIKQSTINIPPTEESKLKITLTGTPNKDGYCGHFLNIKNFRYTPSFLLPKICKDAGITEEGECSSYLDGIIYESDLSIQEKAKIIAELDLTIEEQVNIINKLQLNVEDQGILIGALELTTQEQAQLISKLELTITTQALLLSKMELTVQEQAQLIEEFGFTITTQALLLSKMELTVQEQAYLINELAANIIEKAILIDQLTVNTQEQADLIKLMEISFAEQGQIISQLKNTIEEDAQLIQSLTSNNEEQGKIIAEMELTAQEQAQIIKQLTTTNAEQSLIISQMKLTNEEQAQLIGELTTNNEEQATIIAGLQINLEDKIDIIKELELSLEEEKELINKMSAQIEEQMEKVARLTRESKIKDYIIYSLGIIILILIIGGIWYGRYRKKA